MKNKDKFFDDIARVAGGTVNTLSGLSQSLRDDIRTRVDEMGQRMNFVPREDFEALELRVAALEKKLSAAKPATKAKTTAPAKTAVKKAPVKKTPVKKSAVKKTIAKKKTTK